MEDSMCQDGTPPWKKIATHFWNHLEFSKAFSCGFFSQNEVHSFDIFLFTGRFLQIEGMLGCHYIEFHLSVDTRSRGGHSSSAYKQFSQV
jgi:hypothetical protein